MQNNSLIYDTHDITFVEIPKEISLSFSIMGCQNNCIGCHSPHLRSLTGKIFNEDIDKLLNTYGNYITTILLLGEGHDKNILIKTLEKLKQTNFKIALYSGRDDVSLNLVKYLDYYKVGSYQFGHGGLDSPTTNQRLYKIENGNMRNITSLFWETQSSK